MIFYLLRQVACDLVQYYTLENCHDDETQVQNVCRFPHETNVGQHDELLRRAIDFARLE